MVVIRAKAGGNMPSDVVLHYVLRDGETGLHVYVEYVHKSSMDTLELAQTRSGAPRKSGSLRPSLGHGQSLRRHADARRAGHRNPGDGCHPPPATGQRL